MTYFTHKIFCSGCEKEVEIFNKDAKIPTVCPHNGLHSLNPATHRMTENIDIVVKDSEGAMVSRQKKASWGKNFFKRGIYFKTGVLQSLVDKNWEGKPLNEGILRFYDREGKELGSPENPPSQDLLNQHCAETRVEYALAYPVELDSASLKVPLVLGTGGNDMFWGYAVVLAPQSAKISLTNEIPLRFFKGELFTVGESVEVQKVEPDKLAGKSVPGGHVLHFIFRHPVGKSGQQEFAMVFVYYQ